MYRILTPILKLAVFVNIYENFAVVNANNNKAPCAYQLILGLFMCDIFHINKY